MSAAYDVIVVGAGPAGYVAAIRCAQLGLKTACVDDWINTDGSKSLGGTCLNVGCIPSKALLESSELFVRAQNEFSRHGIRLPAVELDLATMMTRKDNVVIELTQGIEQLFRTNKIKRIHGRACLQTENTLSISSTREEKIDSIAAEHIILAPGSSARALDAFPLLKDRVVDSTGALTFNDVPKRLAIIGAGAIGLELGSVWKRLGAEQVTLFESLNSFLPMVDGQVANQALRLLSRQGLDIQLNTQVLGYEVTTGQLQLNYQNENGTHNKLYDKIIVAVGRNPNTSGLAVAEASLQLDERGFIEVDEHCRTSLSSVYAIGDAVRGPMLAHKGSEEGTMVAELIAGNVAWVNYKTVPSVIYTHPEIAWVGETEESLKQSGIAYKSGVFPFSASGRARALGDTSGMVKVLSDKKTDRLLGVHMIGPQCSELVAQAVVAMELGGSAEDVAMTMFAHPTLSEAFHEAALAVDGKAVHIAAVKR